MSSLDDFMNGLQDISDAVMGTDILSVESQNIPVVVDSIGTSKDGVLGGLEVDIQAIVTAQANHVVNPKLLANKRCTLKGVSYRIYNVDAGTVAVHFTLTSPGAKR